MKCCVRSGVTSILRERRVQRPPPEGSGVQTGTGWRTCDGGSGRKSSRQSASLRWPRATSPRPSRRASSTSGAESSCCSVRRRRKPLPSRDARELDGGRGRCYGGFAPYHRRCPRPVKPTGFPPGGLSVFQGLVSQAPPASSRTRDAPFSSSLSRGELVAIGAHVSPPVARKVLTTRRELVRWRVERPHLPSPGATTREPCPPVTRVSCFRGP